MFKFRYEVSTGKINLITNSKEEINIDGHAYATVESIPEYDNTSQHLYYIDGKIIAVDVA
jgi:hypothetical protein